ncbi:IMC subcompartment protein ISP4 [Toxoplasma gondii RUB]|uniref:IMC subcompartment protein ISP4 n=12 Tax=Toxoplasma gondii TaxID=5811 RepID=A0A125YNG9_TOXGV|nr:IMC subcompartment protein ISP4 [Toxoplasma gondii GT1]ESS33215.1 IMC subcompartment protein ISP4 [Toxoplasma gondii VEG]KAF4642677.1 IMC subcompartment protein ISP4 [Toxoplasma gondii]KFG33653.1 IMC subcompartment protein ISP4 [Toxoplasma gondii p89]KFG36820.1 IMC subcompartment protein ISP4 [Toxoplasma gondii FOU]KFG38218.1 IMC subcompartment protein ISP4 [Toxoplasma gondii GAB2-2007-GAL-DOM2]KFG59146.1 IMC subcompartment protein ISP4 [Toxoplasma gondii RUB]KFH00461.1 IMC subcompartment
MERRNPSEAKMSESGKLPEALAPFICCVRPDGCRPWCGEQPDDELTVAGDSLDASHRGKEDPAALLAEGIICCLMHRDGGSVRCIVKLNRARTALILKAGEKGKTVPLEQIHGVLFGDELKRVDAFEADNTPCVAIYMVSGSAIPIVFPSEQLKQAFLNGVGSLRIGPDGHSATEKKATGE